MRSPLVRMPPRLIRVFSSAHRAVVEASGGRVGARFRGRPLILLTTTGRKTGKARTWPLVGLPYEGGYVVAGSYGGHDRHPAWYLNLRADPEGRVRVGREVLVVRARDASVEERDELWPRFVELLSTYDEYQEATEREIPLVVLEPVGGASGRPTRR